MKILVLVMAVLLVGCANTLENIQTSATAVEASAIVYVTLPPCSPNSGAICSKFSVVQTIENSRKAMKIAVLAARKANDETEKEQLTEVAQTSLQALKDLIASEIVQNVINKLKGE
jgi:hypothetical protein